MKTIDTKEIINSVFNDEERKDIISQMNEKLALVVSNSENVIEEILCLGNDSLSDSRNFQTQLDTKLSLILNNNSKLSNDLERLKSSSKGINALANKTSLLDKGLELIGIDVLKRSMLKKLAKYETIKSVMEEIVESLENGKEIIKNSYKMLSVMKDSISTKQKLISGNILAIEHAIEFIESKNDEKFIAKLELLRENLLDMKILLTANGQFIMMIDSIRTDQQKQLMAVDRSCNITMKMVTIGFVLRTAMENNVRMGKVCKASQEFLSDLMVDNAEFLKERMSNTNNEYQPLILIDKLIETQKLLEETISESNNQANETAKEVRALLEKLNSFSKTDDKKLLE